MDIGLSDIDQRKYESDLLRQQDQAIGTRVPTTLFHEQGRDPVLCDYWSLWIPQQLREIRFRPGRSPLVDIRALLPGRQTH